ncbi:NAD-dependent epimerase/dehydratase family protein [Bacillus sp. BHET2]|uniref:NAD-dependent epimerase/dehydratase family protein n=1 Tax=Bacillus sp. BHET2 TaxID=2583818 RepID=UPI00110F3BD0|nr:NAD-dependent epimerase/dehydratase family protein [Bacillus sp. BHET2]TMU87708.1 NAD-dependent epimerase/dehydratase family protein [Bacillus sp. BHET2]
MKALVTGGAGFIGSHLVDTLISKGLTVHVIDNLSSGKRNFIHPSAIFHQTDITSLATQRIILAEKPDYIFHMAAQADVSQSTLSPLEDLHINVAGTVNLLEACKHVKIKNFVFSSTSAVYGNVNIDKIDEAQPTFPISFYGLSKLTAERYIKLYNEAYNIPYSILRYGNVYGPRQTSKGEGGVIAVFLERLQQNEALKINGDGLQTRDYIYVQDVVEANIAAAYKKINMLMQISTGKKTSILQLIDLIETNHAGQINRFHSADRQGDIKHSCLDNSLAKTKLKWKPAYTIEEGIKKTYHSYLST